MIRDLLKEHDGFSYDSKAYDDDALYMDGDLVVLPYAFDTNDMRFTPGGGFVHARDFVENVIAGFDRLHAEGAKTVRMMSIGLHTRIIGRPSRIGGLEAVLSHIAAKADLWISSRKNIAASWAKQHGRTS
ncbi:MAG: hypothetical protein AAF665_05350 [Pseudomonadota bacterium]